MMRTIFFFLSLIASSFSQNKPSGGDKNFNVEKKGNVIYKYKKFERFDFDELSITGEGTSPGDLSITPRYQKVFKNKLPYKQNFNREIRKSLERIR